MRVRERSTDPAGEQAQAAPPEHLAASLSNRALQQLVAGEHAPSLVPRLPVGNRVIARLVQAKLAVGAVGDPFEREADRIAASVVAAPDGRAAGRGSAPVAVTAARAPAGDAPVAPDAVERSLDGAGAALDDEVRRRFEDRVGHSFADVRVHPDSAAPAAIGATAFTVGSDIVFGPGRFSPDRPEGERLLAHELAHTVQQRGGAAPVQRDGGQPAGTSPTSGGVPVLFGFDQTARRIYVSVTVPGHTVAEISKYLYGAEDKAAELRQANGVGDSVPPGRNLMLVAGTLAGAAQSTVNQALSDGSILRSQGIPVGESGTGPVVVYRFTAGGQAHELTEGQLRAMAQGQATWVTRKATRLHDYAEIGRQTHQEHIDETNSVVRWISNTLAGQDLLPLSVWSDALSQSQSIIGALAAFDAAGGAIGSVVGPVSTQANQLPGAATALDNAQQAWHRYIEGTIGGAEVAVHHLEIVRDASFLIAAGLAGAAVAPVVFAAAGTGLATVGVTGVTATVLSGTAVAGGAVVGGATNTGLNVVAPSSTDTRSTTDQMKSNFGRGAVAGGLGAAGALAAPGVSGAVSQGIYGTAPEALAGAGSRAVVGGVTGAALGVPLGAAGSAIDNVGALTSGQITTEEYLRRIAWGALTGAISGAVLGALGGALSKPQPGTGLSTKTPGAGAGEAPAVEPDVIYQPPQVDPRTGVVSQTLLHRPTGHILRATYNPATGTGDIVNVATGKQVAVVNNGVVSPMPGTPAGLPQPAAGLPPGPAGPSVTVSSGAMPATTAPVIDPFSGEPLGTRTASAQTPQSLVTGIRADEGEAAAWRQALLRGEVGLQAPMGANLAGPDFMTAQFGGNGQATLIVTDVKTSTVARFPPPAATMPATWTAELQAAIQPGRLNIGDPVREDAIRQAFAQGRVRLRQLNADYSPTGGGVVTGF